MKVYPLCLAIIMIIGTTVWFGDTLALEGEQGKEGVGQVVEKIKEEGPSAQRREGLREMGGNVCPVMGGPIDKKYNYTYRGTIYYFCCLACATKFKAAPEKYIKKVRGK